MTSRYKPDGINRDARESSSERASSRLPLWPLVAGNVGLFIVFALLFPVALALVAYLLGTVGMVLFAAVLSLGVGR